jgi:hypothetical protein
LDSAGSLLLASTYLVVGPAVCLPVLRVISNRLGLSYVAFVLLPLLHFDLLVN